MLEVTYYGTATVRLRLPNGIVLVTDPTFDPPGVDYGMTEQGMTRTLAGFPQLDAASVDAVLLSHSDHPDNFDRSGRAFASQVGCIIGTNDVAGLPEHSVPLKPWESYPLGTGESQATTTAVPAGHGPVELLFTGFIIESAGLAGAIYVSGDTFTDRSSRRSADASTSTRRSSTSARRSCRCWEITR